MQQYRIRYWTSLYCFPFLQLPAASWTQFLCLWSGSRIALQISSKCQQGNLPPCLPACLSPCLPSCLSVCLSALPVSDCPSFCFLCLLVMSAFPSVWMSAGRGLRMCVTASLLDYVLLFFTHITVTSRSKFNTSLVSKIVMWNRTL